MRYFLLFAILITGTVHAAPITLKAAYEAARLNMETMRRAQTLVQAAIERRRQAKAALFPMLSGVANETWIDRPKLAGVNPAFILTRQYSVGLRLQQPIIRGGIFSGYESRQEEELLAEYQKDASALTLYQLVLSAYYNLLYTQIDLKNLQELNKFSQERVKELKNLVALGRSRRAELIQAETQMLTSGSQVQVGQMTYTQALENFHFYTGLRPALGDLVPLAELPVPRQGLTEYQEMLKSRPDMKVLQKQVQISEKRIQVAKGGHFPALDLIGNYYIDRTGILQTSEWDIGFVLSFPLFQGGLVSAQIREATETKKNSILAASESLRAAKRDLAILYQNFFMMQGQLKNQSEALKKAEEAWRLNQRDYRKGLVTNLETLQSLNLFIETKRQYDNLYTQSHLTFKNIEASIGVLP